jgi:hypothetical protein
MTVALAVLLTGAFWLPGSAAAQDYAPFLGHWKGTGISETDESVYFAETMRDMDVVIEAEETDGFTLTWTTVTRESGDPENPDVKRSTATLTFRAAGEPGVYHAEPAGDPLAGEAFWWSRIDGMALHTYRLQLRADGIWAVQHYIREITSEGMRLTYTRIADGEPARAVRGRLIKYGG